MSVNSLRTSSRHALCMLESGCCTPVAIVVGRASMLLQNGEIQCKQHQPSRHVLYLLDSCYRLGGNLDCGQHLHAQKPYSSIHSQQLQSACQIRCYLEVEVSVGWQGIPTNSLECRIGSLQLCKQYA